MFYKYTEKLRHKLWTLEPDVMKIDQSVGRQAKQHTRRDLYLALALALAGTMSRVSSKVKGKLVLGAYGYSSIDYCWLRTGCTEYPWYALCTL